MTEEAEEEGKKKGKALPWSGVEIERVGATESEVTVNELVVAPEDEGDAKSGGPVEVKTGVEESEDEVGKASLVLESGRKELDGTGANELEDTMMEKTADELVARAKVDPSVEAGVGAVHVELDDVFATEEVDSVLELEDLRNVNDQLEQRSQKLWHARRIRCRLRRCNISTGILNPCLYIAGRLDDNRPPSVRGHVIPGPSHLCATRV